MNRRTLLSALALSTLVACGGGESSTAPTASTPAQATQRRPNIVLVTLDTTRADHIGSYGHTSAGTDTLDALAARGRRYANARSVMPLTIPSHASIFTGLYPPHHGVRGNNGTVLDGQYTTLAEVLSEAGWRTAASVGAFVTQPMWGFDQGFDVFMHDGVEQGGNFWHGERPAVEVIDDALRWREEQTTSDPLFLWVHLFDAHKPYRAPEAYSEAFPDAPYDAELAYIDDQVERLLASFDDDNTLVVVIGDHGESLDEHGEAGHGLYVYDATQHVPYFMAGPGIEAGVVEEVVSQVDLLPTVLDYLGLDPLSGIDGQVMPGSEPRPVYMESWSLSERFGFAPHIGLVDGNEVYIEQPTPELYDVSADPGQLTNLAPDHTERVAAFRTLLAGMEMPPPGGGEAVADPAVAMQLEALGYIQSAGGLQLRDGSDADAKEHRELLESTSRLPALTHSGDEQGALELTERLIERYPDILYVHLERYRVLRHFGHGERARAAMAVVRERFPDSEVARTAEAHEMVRQARYADAAAAFRELAQAAPHNPALRSKAVWSLLQEPTLVDEAKSLGLAYLEAHPEDHDLSGILGLVYLREGEPEIAAPMLEKGCQADRPLRGVCEHVGVMARLQGDLALSRRLLDRELRFHPTNDNALRAIQVVLGEQGEWGILVVAVSRLIALRGESAYLWVVKAQAEFNQEKFTEARASLTRSLALRPDWSQALLLDANLLAKEGNMDAARARFEEAKAAQEREEAEAAATAPPSEEAAPE